MKKNKYVGNQAGAASFLMKIALCLACLLACTAIVNAAASGSPGGTAAPPPGGGGLTTGDVVFWIGIVTSVLGWFILMGAAFEAGTGWVFLCFICSPLFVLFKFKAASKGFMIQMGGVVLYCIGMHMGVTNSSKWLIEMVGPLQTLRNMVSDVSPEEKNRGSAYDPATQKQADGYGQSREGGPEVSAPMTHTAPGATPKPGTPPPSTNLESFMEKSDAPAATATATAPAPASIASPVPKTFPLIEAVKRGDAGQVTKLLESGEAVNTTDADGWTALMHAASKGSVETVQALLNKGADVNARDAGGWTALMLAAYGGNRAVIQSLLDKGADVKASTSRKTTALICAAGSGHGEAVQALVDAKADVDAKDSDGRTALSYAAEKKHATVVEILRKAGAKESVPSS